MIRKVCRSIWSMDDGALCVILIGGVALGGILFTIAKTVEYFTPMVHNSN